MLTTATSVVFIFLIIVNLRSAGVASSGGQPSGHAQLLVTWNTCGNKGIKTLFSHGQCRNPEFRILAGFLRCEFNLVFVKKCSCCKLKKRPFAFAFFCKKVYLGATRVGDRERKKRRNSYNLGRCTRIKE